MSDLEKIRSLEAIRNIRPRNPMTDWGPSRTKQADREEADINSIVAKYNRTGVAPGMKHLPEYGDDTASKTLHESMTIVREAEAAFASLPAEVRDAVGNDPANLLDLVADPDRVEQAIKLGLVDAPEVPWEPGPKSGEVPPDTTADKAE